MSAFLLARQATAHRVIMRRGRKAFLRRGSTDRPCWAAIVEWKPHERALVQEGAVHFYVSAKDLAIPPDHELDRLVFAGKIYRIVAPDRGMRPDGVTVIYHDLEAVYDSGAV